MIITLAILSQFIFLDQVYNVDPQPQPQPSYYLTEASSMPEAFNWVDQLSPSKPQGHCGACVAFALVNTLEAQHKITCAQAKDLSTQHLFSCSGGKCKGGLLLTQAVTFAMDNGIPTEPCFAYQEKDVSCLETCPDSNIKTIKPLSVSRPTTGYPETNLIKQAILKGPVLSSILLYENLETYKSGIFKAEGTHIGSHAVTIVGWDDSDKTWLIQNSWGEDWGMGGLFKVQYNDQKVLPGRYTWSFEMSCEN